MSMQGLPGAPMRRIRQLFHHVAVSGGSTTISSTPRPWVNRVRQAQPSPPVAAAAEGSRTPAQLAITAVKAYPTPKGFPGRNMLFVKVECVAADGRALHGWGESGMWGRRR
jgi:hypothetical protein